MVLTTAGFVLVFLGAFFTPLTPFLAISLEFLISLFFNIICFFSGLPWANFVFSPLPWLLTFGYYALFLFLV